MASDFDNDDVIGMVVRRGPRLKRITKTRKTIMSLPPPTNDKTIATPHMVVRLATTTAPEEIAPEKAIAVIDTMAKEIPTLVEPADDSAASKVDTIPQQHEPTKIVSPVNVVVMLVIDKIVDSIVNKIPVSVKPAEDTAALKGETLPQPSTTALGDEPKDATNEGQGNVIEKIMTGAAVDSMVLANQQYKKVRTNFQPKKKRYPGQERLNVFEQELLKIFLNCWMDLIVLWKNDYVNTTRASLYTMLDRKEMVKDDVMDTFICIIQKSLTRVPYLYMKCTFITRPLALFMSKQEDASETALTMMGDAARNLYDVDIVILPIIINAHFHLVVLNNNKQEYMYYTSAESEE
ncbi:uncharacterized protein LOC120273234 [Dioscorea cayenensis subsp. rotundata]|uniref:Uncharacterized protein LOC120273234 n=1 Tax=Dioscorea cayennensis subsp. rotundata TaxID=55577 RepID=A0AB40C7H8_DIOCR|nr:uncharacterized protein LOC120273234 [Dioscorea cayenensis subsp. rotundata]